MSRRGDVLVEWHVYDFEDEATNPPRELFGEMLWVVEQFYVEGVTIGLYDGFTFRVLPSGSDDCSVTHWARIETPLGPEVE